MLLESQEQEGRSCLCRLVRKVLYCSSHCPRSQRRRRADVRTFYANHECFKTGRSKLWSCLHEIIFFSSTGWYRKHFFLSSPMRPKRSSIFSFLFFSRVQHEWIWIKGFVESSYAEEQVKLTTVCRLDYLHKNVLDKDWWNGHHDQAHIFFLGESESSSFSSYSCSVSSLKCRLLHPLLQMYSFLHRLILKSV